MKKGSIISASVSIIMTLAIILVSACAPTPTTTPGATAPTVISTNPGNTSNVAANGTIAATFSEAMNPSTVNAGTFTLKKGSTPIAGTVTYAGTTATFTPGTGLELCTTYTATITAGVQNMAGNALARDYAWNFYTSCAGSGTGAVQPSSTGVSPIVGGGGGAPEVFALKVISTNPVNAATGVALNSKITTTFNGGVNNTTFTLKLGTTPVPGNVTYTGNTAIFTPAANLAPNTLYTATITTGGVSQVWTFTTGAAPPTVTLTNPIDNGPCWPTNWAISAVFSKVMKSSTIISPATTFTLTQAGVAVPGVVSYTGFTATFTPTANLAPNLPYIATITTVAKDLAGNALAVKKVWHFNSCAGVAPPTVISTIPTNGATDVALNSKIYATFSQAMNPLTLNSTTFTLQNMTTSIFVTPLSVTYAGTTATFTPPANLAPNTSYTATITTGAQDLTGTALAAAYTWTFTTINPLIPPLGPDPVDLGTAGNFALLSKSGISTTGVTSITGDIGASPIDDTAITGFGLVRDSTNTFSTTMPTTLVTGKVYAANMAAPTPAYMTQAISDMETAFTDAAGRATPPIITNFNAGNLGGQTLAPGLYKFTTDVTIPTDLTLAGGANDVWIFQITGKLDLSSAKKVILSGGALPKNIFWQASDTVTLNTDSVFNGNILAQTNIRMLARARLNGRALAQTAVTMDATTVVKP